MSIPLRALFVNSGILGMASFAKFIREAAAVDPDIDATHINLSEDLTTEERIVRRLLCMRFWPDGLAGVKNLDLGRFRQEYHAGLQAAKRIRQVLATNAIDVLHFHRQATAYASIPLMQRVPAVVSIDATQDVMLDIADSVAERWSYLPNAVIDGRVFRAAAAIVSTSRWAASCLHRRYPDCTTPVYVMPPPVRLQFLHQRWIDDRYDRAAAPGYMPRVLFVGGAFVRKGGPDLLAAWCDAELYRIAKLDLVTDWPIASPAMPGVRILRGVQSYSSEWSELWRAADIFVLPTHHEAFGTVFQEAGAAGLPRIGTNIYAIPETISDGDDGLLIQPGDRRALASALERLIASRELRFALGTRARRQVMRVSSAPHYMSQLKDIMFSVAKQPGTFRLDTPA